MTEASTDWINRWAVPLTAITAAITLVVALVDLIASKQGYERLGNIDAVIKDTEQLRQALRKPLEGVWDYRADYSKFWGEDGKWLATGEAIFIWHPEAVRYEVFLGASLVDARMNAKPLDLVTWRLHSNLSPGRNGQPAEPFALIFRYLGRTAFESSWTIPQNLTATFDNFTSTVKRDGETVELRGQFNGKDTTAEITFTRRD